MMGRHPSPVVFFKHMTHHLVELDWEFMNKCVNVVLTRDPFDMLTSFVNQIQEPKLSDTGYAAHHQVVKYLNTNQLPVIVLDGKNVLLNPKKVLSELCNKTGIPFKESMLKWEAGPRPEDGIWAKNWYHNVHKSTGFAPYKSKNVEMAENLKQLYEECLPHYQELKKMAIQP